MENQFKLDYNGQQVQQQDFATLGEAAGLADDRVFAELFRLQPFDGSTVRRGVLPFGNRGQGRVAMVAPNGATGSVSVSPFRAFIGSTTAVGTDAVKNWRDIRSTLCVGSSALAQTVPLGANSSGNPRWDLIYAAVTPNVNGPSVTRKVKNPTSKVVTTTSVAPTLVSTVTLGVTPGTPAASPDWPAAPTDAAGTYYIPLAYVRVPNGFAAGSTVLSTGVAEQAPVIALSRTTGGCNARIADSQYTEGGAQLSAAKVQAWGATGTRPSTYLPPSMGAGEQLIVVLDLTTGHESVANNATLDSRDWRNRVCKFTAVVGVTNPGVTDFPWMRAGFQTAPAGGESSTSANVRVAFGVGQTFVGSGTLYAASIDGNALVDMADGTTISVYCDLADSGKLKVLYTGAPNCAVIFWIDFSAPFDGS